MMMILSTFSTHTFYKYTYKRSFTFAFTINFYKIHPRANTNKNFYTTTKISNNENISNNETTAPKIVFDGICILTKNVLQDVFQLFHRSIEPTHLEEVGYPVFLTVQQNPNKIHELRYQILAAFYPNGRNLLNLVDTGIKHPRIPNATIGIRTKARIFHGNALQAQTAMNTFTFEILYNVNTLSVKDQHLYILCMEMQDAMEAIVKIVNTNK